MEGSFILGLGHWAWFLLAALLLGLELFVPGAFMFWLGLAAAGTGAIAMLVPLGWQAAILLFAVLSVAAVLVGRTLARRAAPPDDQTFLNQRGEALVGREFILSDPIVAGAGRVRVGDSVWRILGPDVASGTKVRVLRVEGAALVVEPR